MKKLYKLTQAGVDEIKAELASLTSERGNVADRIRQARELGDLSENAEYQSAREEQDRLEARIGELEHVLQNMELIKKPRVNGHVQLGSKVKLKSSDGNTRNFQVVGTFEADPAEGKISDESPIGKALLGKKKGETMQLKSSTNGTAFKIIDIS